MSLRLRVAVFTAAGTSILMVLGSIAVLAAFRTDQIDSLDALLAGQYQVLALPAATAARFDRPLLDELANARLSAPAIVRVWEGEDLLLEIGADDLENVPVGSDGYRTEQGQSGSYRILKATVEPRLAIGRSVDVEVAISLDEIDAVYQRLRLRVRRIVLLGVVLFGLAGWAAATAALAPLRRLRRATEEVTGTNDLSMRVSEVRDPAEIRELATSFDAMLDRLERSDSRRQEALDAARTFAAAAAHELRTPLTSMGANLEVLAAHPDFPDRDTVIGDLQREHSHLRDLLGALRQLSRGDLIGPEAFEDFDLADLAEQAVVSAVRRYPDAELTLEAPDGPSPIWGWPEGLRLMIDNLIANAVSHGLSDDGKPRVAVRLIRSGKGIELSVSDQGPGIPSTERKSVMERFVRGSTSQGSGSGLGLALAAQQAHIHGGTLVIGDAPGGGASVIFRLPHVSLG